MKFFLIFCGFILGVAAAFAGIVLYGLSLETEYEPKFNLGSLAYTDTSRCPDLELSEFIGVWAGEKIYPDTGTRQKWAVSRHPSGTFTITFNVEYSDGSTTVKKEEGLWSYSNCLYSTITKKLNGDRVLYQEVYRIHEMDDKHMRYTNYRTGNTFELQKLSR